MATKKSTKAFDIHKPGKTAPDASARPTIVTNRTLKRDPMMREDAAASEPVPEQTEFKPHTELKIQPLHSDITPEDSPVTTEPAVAEPAPELAKPIDEPQPAEEAAPAADATPLAAAEPPMPAEPPVANEPPAESEPAAAESTDTAAAPDAKAAAKTAAAEQAATEQAKLVQKLADSHKYFLPINQVRKRHNRAALTWLLVIIVIIVAADLALDAGLFSIPNFQPPTHFFGH